MVPDSGFSRPATQRKVVDLPQPDGPSRVKNSPSGTRMLTLSIAASDVLPLWKDLRRLVISIIELVPSQTACFVSRHVDRSVALTAFVSGTMAVTMAYYFAR